MMRALNILAPYIAALMVVSGCGGVILQAQRDLRLKNARPVTSCQTVRATQPGQVDTVDASWVEGRPLAVTSYSDSGYPAEALAAKQGGIVEVTVLIAPDGKVDRIVGVTGPDVFREQAIQVVRGMLVSPPQEIYHQPVAVCGTVIVTFQAKEDGLTWVQLR